MLFYIYLFVPNFAQGVGNWSCSYLSPFPLPNEHFSPTPRVLARPALMKTYKYFSQAGMEAGSQKQIQPPGPAWAAASRWGGPWLAPAKPLVIHRPAKDACNLESTLVIEKNKSWLNFLDGRGNAWPWQPRTTEIFNIFPFSIYFLNPTKVRSIPAQQPPPWLKPEN